MTNIEPKYVTFKQAVILKEKGFDVPCNKYYQKALTSKKDRQDGYTGPFGWKKGELSMELGYFVNNDSNDFTNKNWYLCSCPEQWQVIEWLESVYGIDVDVTTSRVIRTNRADGYTVNAYTPDYEVFHWDLGGRHPTRTEAYSAAFDYILPRLPELSKELKQ